MTLSFFHRLYRADSVAVSVGAGAAAGVISRLIGLGRGVALAWLIPQAQFGLLGIALIVVNVLLPLCSAGIYEGVTRYAPSHESAGTLRRFALRASMLVIAVALSATAILGWFARPVGSVLFSAAGLALHSGATSADGTAHGALMRISLLCVLALAAYQTLLGMLKGLRMFRAVGTAEVFTACVFTLLALAAALNGFPTAQALIAAYAIACLAAVSIFAPGLALRIASTDRKSGEVPVRPRFTLLRYGAWAAATAVVWQALFYYPMWYLLKVSDHATVGTFHAVRTVTQFIHIAAVMLTSVVTAHVTRSWEHRGRAASSIRLAVLTKVCLLALTIAATVLSLVRPLLMRVFPDTFAAGTAAYDPLVSFFLLVGVVGLMAVRLNLVEKPRWVCVAWLVGALVNVVVSYLLLGPAGGAQAGFGFVALRAASWAGVAGAAAALLVCIGLVRREGLPLDLPTMLLTAATLSVGLGWRVAMPLAAVLVVIALGTSFVFPPHERALLRRLVATGSDS